MRTATSHNRTPRRARIIATFCVAVLSLTACGGSDTGGSGSTTVKLGVQPLLDYVPWVFAQDHGLAKEQGLNLDIKYITQLSSGVQATKRGSVDMASSCSACNMPFVESDPSLREVMVVDQFKGFILIGRKGAPEYDKLVAGGATPEEARAKVYDYMKGRTLVGVKAIYGSLLSGLLEYAGMQKSDLKLTDFADDPKAATAFIQGKGDFYMGTLAQESKLLKDYPGKFVNVGGSAVLGPAGLWYSTMVMDQSYVEKNPSNVDKLAAIAMRTARYINEKPEIIVPVLVKALNENSGSTFTDAQIKDQLKTFIQFADAGINEKSTFEPSSDLYWKRSLDFYTTQSKKDGTLKSDKNIDKIFVEEDVFKRVKSNAKLMEWVNSPLD